MSGGSYNYLCYKSLSELIEEENDIQNMADSLAKLGYASDAAKETEEILLTIRQFQNRIETMKKRLQPIWKSFEWWMSRDSSEESFKKELENYRKG